MSTYKASYSASIPAMALSGKLKHDDKFIPLEFKRSAGHPVKKNERIDLSTERPIASVSVQLVENGDTLELHTKNISLNSGTRQLKIRRLNGVGSMKVSSTLRNMAVIVSDFFYEDRMFVLLLFCCYVGLRGHYVADWLSFCC